jgi:hypothetical protein
VHATETRQSIRLRLASAAWITILILTGAFQVYRQAFADAAVFILLAAALVVGETGILSRLDGRAIRPRRIAIAVVLALDAIVLVFTPRHGYADGIALAVTGVLVFIVAWPNESATEQAKQPWSPRLTRAALAWTIVGIAFCVWELAMYFLGYGAEGRTDFPALSDILDPILNNPVGRVIGVAAWLAGGVALTRRGRTSE